MTTLYFEINISEGVRQHYGSSVEISLLYEDQPYSDFKSLFLLANGGFKESIQHTSWPLTAWNMIIVELYHSYIHYLSAALCSTLKSTSGNKSFGLATSVSMTKLVYLVTFYDNAVILGKHFLYVLTHPLTKDKIEVFEVLNSTELKYLKTITDPAFDLYVCFHFNIGRMKKY